MRKLRSKPNYRRRVLRLPDLDHCKSAVLNSLGSPASSFVWECRSPNMGSDVIVGTWPAKHARIKGPAVEGWRIRTMAFR